MLFSDFNRRKAFYYLCGVGSLFYVGSKAQARSDRSENTSANLDLSLNQSGSKNEHQSMQRYTRSGEAKMRLIVMRHGIAHDLGQDGSTTDATRTLTSEGIQQVQHVAESLKRLEPTIHTILSSPYRRALQTASKVAEIYGKKAEAEETLMSGAKPKPILRMLANRQEECLLVCGHQPTLGQLISVACMDEKDTFYLKPAGMACVVFEEKIEPGSAYLEWLMQPEQLLKVLDFQ